MTSLARLSVLTMAVALPAGAASPAAAAGPSARAAATQSCSVSNQQEGTVGVTRLRATRTSCSTARSVVAALRLAGRRGRIDRSPRAAGRTFSCSFRRRGDMTSGYYATTCRSGTRTVSLRFYAPF